MSFVIRNQIFKMIPLFCLITPRIVFSQETSTDQEKTLGMEQSAESQKQSDQNEPFWFEKTADYVGNKIDGFSTYIDHSLAPPEEQDEEALEKNLSYIRLRSTNGYSHYSNFNSDTGISLRIDLPYTKKKWHLIFESDPDDQNSLESKERDLIPQNTNNDLDSAIGGVRVEDDWLKNWKTNLDIGVKFTFPLDPFTRAEIRRVENISDSWVAQFRQQAFYYDSKGAGTLSRLSFYHGLDDTNTRIFSFNSSAQYLNNNHDWELVSSFSLSDRISQNQLLEYSLGLSIDPQQTEEITNSWISFASHHNIYKNWLYLSVIPQINMARGYDYKVNPGIIVRFDAFISKHRNIRQLNRSIPSSTRKNN